MVIQLLYFGSFVAAIVLILSSAWLASRGAYYAILILLVAGFTLAEVPSKESVVAMHPLNYLVDALIFGANFYFVTVQQLMGRKFNEPTSRQAFREALQEKGKFSGFARFVYYLPIVLLLGAVAVAGTGAYLSSLR
jgi:hypothetical protein